MTELDMPLKELEKYKGTNPCPSDYKDYWDKAMAEMKATDAHLEMVPAKFQVPFAECFDLFFTGVRGARIHAKYIRPKNSKGPHPAILEFHGYKGNCGEWNTKLKYAANGFCVAALDCRGQGGLSEDTGGVKGSTISGHITRGFDDIPENLLYRNIFLDTAQLASIVMSFPEVDENRVGTTGASQGGGLSLVCAALEPRIKRVVSYFPFLSDYQRVWNMNLAYEAYADIREYFRTFDPLHQREEEFFTKLGYIDIQHIVERIQGEVLMYITLMDTICPPSTQFAAYNKIQSKKKSAIYKDYGHEAVIMDNDMEYSFLTAL